MGRNQECCVEPALVPIRKEIADLVSRLRTGLLELAPLASRLRQEIRAEQEITNLPVGKASTRQANLDAPPFADWESIAGLSNDMCKILDTGLGLNGDVDR